MVDDSGRFAGFSQEGLDLLAELPTLDTDAFRTRRAPYVSELQRPLKAFVSALGPVLRSRISSGIDFAPKTHGSIGPINNDVRFNPDAPTYKDHVLLRFWEGPKKKTAPTLYVRLTPDEVGFATGSSFSDVESWREAVDRDGDRLRAAMDDLRDAAGDVTVAGQVLKRVPRGYDPDHPHGDLLRHKSLQVRWHQPLSDAVHDDGFVEVCAGELEKARGVHRWMVEYLTP